MVENSKQVRVDNWGVFFLQRLQMFFNKTDYCDLTLQFDGNVQLKVHRLVMNACTEYFQVLEQSCDVVDDNIILMPPDLQADVILPVVNFMYTGTLEYHPSIYERLVHTAELMNIPILIKLLEAHKAAPVVQTHAHRRNNNPSHTQKQLKKTISNTTTNQKRPISHTLPHTLPGRKLPVWKRKTAPLARSTIVPRDRAVTVPSVDNMGSGVKSGVGTLVSTYKSQADSVSYVDNQPKPTRFEWPDGEDEKMRTETYMESSAFDNLTSYSSLPLIRGEDTEKIPIYEELRYAQSSPVHHVAPKRRPGHSPYTARRPNHHIEQDEQHLDAVEAEEYADDPDYHPDVVLPSKRVPHGTVVMSGVGAKRVRFNEKENIKKAGASAQISASSDIDHNKLIAELFKKYPNLAKTNKNIKFKIMTKPTAAPSDKQPTSASSAAGSSKQQSGRQMASTANKARHSKGAAVPQTKNTTAANKKILKTAPGRKYDHDGPWTCDKCSIPPDPYHLYYLYRKHMTDVHQEQFSPLMCKYCGKRTRNDRALSFHMHTVHGAVLGNIVGAAFPQCERCPFTALTERRLSRHRATHHRGHVQCPRCRVGFNGLLALSNHQQITNHVAQDSDTPSSAGLTSYDCQYCTRNWQNSATLFVHLRTAHREDARRDGILSVDEDPEEDEEIVADEDETGPDDEDETILQHHLEEQHETAAGPSIVDKVKIITNVKVSGTSSANDNTVQMQMSNAGIATTLGLVDIVVLDENQQYILQSSNGDLDQSEFILPQITGSFVHQGQQVITTSAGQVHQVIQQTVNTQQTQQSGVTSTDELVMVLTDHDYNDETAENAGQMSSEGNSNIVVLYSHPIQAGNASSEGRVPGENGGSLLVQTAEGQVLEIRNGPPDLVDHSSQQESIELIQREIHNTQSEDVIEVGEEQKTDDNEEPDEQQQQQQQQVMLVVTEDEEDADDNQQERQQFEEQLVDESVDEQDARIVVERSEEEEDGGQDVCGSQDGDTVPEQQEAMEVDDTEDSVVDQQQDTSADFPIKESPDINATLMPHSPVVAKSPELSTIQEETETYSNEIIPERNDVEPEEAVSKDETANPRQDGDEIQDGAMTEEAAYSPEAMEVDSSERNTEEVKNGDTTDNLDDSIIEHGESIDEALNEQEKGDVANSTFEEDQQETQNVTEQDIHQPENLDNTVIDDGGALNESKDATDVSEDPAVISDEPVEEAGHNITEEVPETVEEVNPDEKQDATSETTKTTQQNSTIALLDDWEDTEDSSSQDKNCHTTTVNNSTITTTPDAVNKLINDDWDDDD